MKIIKLLTVNLFLFFILDQFVGLFINNGPEYLNKSQYPWESYSTNYRGYFEKITQGDKFFFGLKRNWEDRIYHSKPIPEGKRRVLTIGDSFTFGQGVRFKDNYTNKVSSLDNKFIGINLANSGSDLKQIEKSLNDHIKKIKPEHVIYGYCLNDMIAGKSSNIQFLDYNTKTKPIKDIGLKWDFINKRTTQINLGRNSRLYDFFKWSPLFKKIYQSAELKSISKQTMKHYKDLYSVEKNKNGIKETIDGIIRLKNKSLKNNAKFTIIIFPIIFWPNQNYFLEAEHSIFINLLEENHINYRDMKDEWLKFEDRDLWVHPVDQHPNNIAHGLVARKIINLLNKTE